MTDRDLADLRAHISELLTVVVRFQDEMLARIGSLEKWREQMEAARTDTTSRMTTWTESLTTAGRLLSAIYKIWLAVSYMAPALIPIWRLIRSYL